MNNIILERIASFLKAYHPFNYLSNEDLLNISSSTKVLNLEKDKSIFQINDHLHDCFYIIFSGVIHLTVISDSEEILLNKCYLGDVFGLRPFFAKNNYQMTAKAREESVLLAIPITVFKPYLINNTEISNFLLESFATNSKSSLNKENTNKVLSDSVMFTENQSDTSFFQTLRFSKNPLCVSKNKTIKEVAIVMSENLQDNAIVTENNLPIGIVTDKDFRSKVATGRVEINTLVYYIMSSPVITVSESISVAEAQLMMLKYNLTHLCVTFDGSEKSEIKGVISEHDLVVAQANNPGVLMKEIKKAQNASDLKKVSENLSEIIQSSLSKNIPITHVNTIAGEITLAIIKRCIELAILELGSPPANFAWLCIGSQGRKEQLLMTNQDSILVFEDVTVNRHRDVKDYFMQLAKKATILLEKIGYKNSPNGYVASNMNWCKSLSDWIKQYDSWINTPGEKSNDINTILFDYEIAFGDQKIEDAITENIFSKANNNILFLDYLGNDALRKPAPLNFFKKFNLEEEGENKNKFDVKTKGLLPLIDAARLLVLSMNIKGINSTYLRFKQLAIEDIKYSEVYLNCAEAYLVLSKFRTIEGLKNDNSGQFLNLEEFSKIDKEKLKNALIPMRELENLIKSKFQLTQFS